MADKGERNKPLIITEYGILFPEDYVDEDNRSFDQVRVGAFMTGTFDLLLNETDAVIGYPYDENRLVQRWAWFSLAENPNNWGGTLFEPDTQLLRPLGQAYLDATNAISPSVDLMATEAYGDPIAVAYEGTPAAVNLSAVISNIGNIPVSQVVTVSFLNGPPGEVGTQPIGSVQTIAGGLQGCGDHAGVSVVWTGLSPGLHIFYVHVDPQGAVPEVDKENNVRSGIVLVAPEIVFMPVLIRAIP
jgi:hypothetical protein